MGDSSMDELRYFKNIGFWSGLAGGSAGMFLEFRRIYQSAVPPAISMHQFLKLLAIVETVTLTLFLLAALTIFVRRR